MDIRNDTNANFQNDVELWRTFFTNKKYRLQDFSESLEVLHYDKESMLLKAV